MHPRRVLAAALLALAAGSAAAVRAAEDEPAAIAWRTDLATATAEAAESGLPLLVVFRCPP